VRLNLDLFAERACAAHEFAEPLARLDLPLGSAPLVLALQGGPLAPQAIEDDPAPAAVEFAAVLALGDEPPLVAGAASITAVPAVAGSIQLVSLGEDWSAAALVALFAAAPVAVNLIGQYRFRSGAEAAANTGWHYSQTFTVRVPNTIIPSVLVPGAVSVAGNLYLARITDYTGGTASALDAVETANLPLGTVLRIITANGESAWRVEAGTAATDVASGIIRPLDYDAGTNAKNFIRVAGL